MVTDVSTVRTGYSSNKFEALHTYPEDPQYEAITDMKPSNLRAKNLNITVFIPLYYYTTMPCSTYDVHSNSSV